MGKNTEKRQQATIRKTWVNERQKVEKCMSSRDTSKPFSL